MIRFEIADHEPSLLPDGEWVLAWSDEFDGDRLDDTKWSFRRHLFHKEHRAWARSIVWPILFLVLNAGCTALSWQGWLSLLPMLGSSLNVVGLWCSNPTRLRLVSLPAQTLWEVYSIAVGAIPSIIVNAISITSILIALIREWVERRKGKETT